MMAEHAAVHWLQKLNKNRCANRAMHACIEFNSRGCSIGQDVDPVSHTLPPQQVMLAAQCWAQRQPAWRLLAAVTALHCAAMALFSSGFLLTRVELTRRSGCNDAGCLGQWSGMSAPRDPQQCCAAAGKGCSDASSRTAGDCPRSSTSAADQEQCGNAGASAADQQPDQLSDQAAADAVDGGCCCEPHFNKTLWLIIDALRFDFVLHEPSAAGLDIRQGDAALGLDPPPPREPPPLPPHVQRMPELLSLATDWVRTAVIGQPWSYLTSAHNHLAGWW